MLHPLRLPSGWTGLAFDEIDSTNSEALRRAAAGERGPLWITARHQIRGRGRSGRTWASAGGSLAATLLFAPGCALAALAELSLVAGVAAHVAIAAELPADARTPVRLKWPNDVLIGGAKVCGILVETSMFGADLVAAIGTGINVAEPPEIEGRTGTSLAEHGASADVAGVGGSLAIAMAEALSTWDGGRGFAVIRRAWLDRAGALGEPMSVHAGGEKVVGLYAGLDHDGGLLIDVGAGERRKFSFGDVALGRPRV